MESLISAGFGFIGVLLGGGLSYFASLRLFKIQSVHQTRLLAEEFLFQKNDQLYKKLEEYKAELGKSFWEAQNLEKKDETYYTSQGNDLKKLVDEINYLSLFSAIPTDVYSRFSRDILTYWRSYTWHIGFGKYKEMMDEDKSIAAKKKLASDWSIESLVIDEMLKVTGEEIKKYVKNIRLT